MKEWVEFVEEMCKVDLKDILDKVCFFFISLYDLFNIVCFLDLFLLDVILDVIWIKIESCVNEINFWGYLGKFMYKVILGYVLYSICC